MFQTKLPEKESFLHRKDLVVCLTVPYNLGHSHVTKSFVQQFEYPYFVLARLGG